MLYIGGPCCMKYVVVTANTRKRTRQDKNFSLEILNLRGMTPRTRVVVSCSKY